MSRCACGLVMGACRLFIGSLKALLIIGNVLVALLSLGIGLTSFKLAYDKTLAHRPYASLYVQVLGASLSSLLIAMLGLRATYQPHLKFGLKSFSAMTITNGLLVLACIMWSISRGSIGRANQQLLEDLGQARASYNWSGAWPEQESYNLDSELRFAPIPLREQSNSSQNLDAEVGSDSPQIAGSMALASQDYYLIKQSLANESNNDKFKPSDEPKSVTPVGVARRNRYDATTELSLESTTRRNDDTIITSDTERENGNATPNDFDEVTSGWDEVQSSLQCCGLKDSCDWDSFRPKGLPKTVYPSSCCSWQQDFSRHDQLHALLKDRPVCQQGDKLFKIGCSQRLGQFESSLLRCASLFFALQLILGALACCVSSTSSTYQQMGGHNTHQPYESYIDDVHKVKERPASLMSGDFEKVYKPPNYDSVK